MGDAGNVIASEREDGAYFYNKDMRSSTTTVTDGSGNCKAAYEYTDFGETKVNSDFYNEIAYTGGIWDQSTGLSGHRFELAFAMNQSGRYLVKGAVKRGEILLVSSSGVLVTVAAVIGTSYIAWKTYKKIRALFSKGGKQNVRDFGLSGYSDAEVSSLARNRNLSAKERSRFVKEEKARKNRNKQRRDSKSKGKSKKGKREKKGGR